ncbi:hypothetical protein [Streptomyces sp. NPDC002559]
MPARSRIPDPSTGALAAFAYDLRQLGAGKIPIPAIAERSYVSRAALYAAISGTRLPSSKTVATLIRWWAGDPSAESKMDEDHLSDPVWGWTVLLPRDHPAQKTISNWERRYRDLVRELDEGRVHRPAAAPVRIAIPPEQQKFIDELQRLIDSTGLQDSRWLLFGELNRKVTSYLAGNCLPEHRNISRIVMTCLETQGFELDPDGPDDDEGWDLAFETMERLEELVAEARVARARERRKARGG